MTDWEAMYQSGETGWDKGAPAPPLLDWLEKNEVHGRWLVPGCGRGHDVRALVEAGAEALGLDIAPSAVEAARESGANALLGDLFALPAEVVGAFDGVFEHTCFCAIPREQREEYVKAVHAALKPGGLLLALFYLRPRDDPDPTIGPPFSTSLEELDGLFAPYFALETDEVPAVAFEGREGRERLRLLRRKP